MAWYVSLAMLWKDQKGLEGHFFQSCDMIELPGDRIRVAQRSMHCTLYAHAKIDRVFEPYETMHESARAVLDFLYAQDQIRKSLEDLPSFEFRPQYVKHFSNATTIQFALNEEEPLIKLRRRIREALRQLGPMYISPAVQLPFDGKAKNNSGKLWGSLARSPVRQTEDVPQQFTPFPKGSENWVRPEKAIFTISDETLGNELCQGDYHTVNFRDSSESI